jgi:membrane protease YdiL (CAAX protease family)
MVRSVAARQVRMFIGLVFTMAIGVALALPHSPVAPAVSIVIPLVAVLLVTAFGTRPGQRKALWSDVGLARAGLGSWPVALVLPAVFLPIGYVVAAVLGIASYHRPATNSWLVIALSQLLSIAVAAIVLLGEEIGWRGFLLPRLQALTSGRRAAVLTGFTHGLFHLPLILLTTTYDIAGNRYVVAPLAVATITGAGVFYAWLKDRSGSIWPVTIAHATANTVFAVGAAAAVTSTPAALAYTAGESGVVTFLVIAGIAVILLARGSTWDRHQQVPAVENPPVPAAA